MVSKDTLNKFQTIRVGFTRIFRILSYIPKLIK